MLLPVIDILIDGGGNDAKWVQRYLPKLASSRMITPYPIDIPIKFRDRFHKIYVFEPNPAFHQSYEGTGMILIKKAIWTGDCHMPMYMSKDERQANSSLYEDKLSRVQGRLLPNHWHEEKLTVECVDFSMWLKNMWKPYYNIIVKLDIEGAEYEVLFKMLRDGTIKLINTLYVEFHTETLQSKAPLKPQLMAELRATGIELIEWD